MELLILILFLVIIYWFFKSNLNYPKKIDKINKVDKIEKFNWFYPPSRCINNVFGDTSCFPSRYPPSYGDPPYYPYYNGPPYYYSYYYPSYYPYYPSLSFASE